MQANTERMTGKQHLMKKPSIKLRRKTTSMVSACLKAHWWIQGFS